MKYYFYSRHTQTAVIVVTILGFVLALFALKPIIINHPTGLIVFTPATPLQIIAVAAVTLALSSRNEQFESLGTRPLPTLRALNLLILAGTGVLQATAVTATQTVLHTDPGTIGPYGPLRAFLGLQGIALIAATFADTRLAALCPLPFTLLPAVTDTQALPYALPAGFTLAHGENTAAWLIAALLMCTGTLLYVFAYRSIKAPASDRQALQASKPYRKHRNTKT